MTAPGHTAVVKVGSLAIPRRAVSLFATVTMTVGGMVIAYVIPVVLGLGDARSSTDGARVAGLILGLLVAFLGIAALDTSSHPRRKAPQVMASIPTSLPKPVVQVLRGRGYHATNHAGDDLRVTFAYHPQHPYSVRLDFSAVDPFDGSLSDTAVWEVSRDVLSAGAMYGLPNELGDFRVIEPTTTGFRLRLMSSSKADECCGKGCTYYDVHLSRSEVRSFLLRTFAVIPEGGESDHVDVDMALERLLYGR